MSRVATWICAVLFACALTACQLAAEHTGEPLDGNPKLDVHLPQGQLSRIAIATAYDPELAALLPKLEESAAYRINGVSYWTGRMSGQDVVLFKTGVSLVNGAMNTERLLNHFNIRTIIVSGVAGGLDPSLTIGDVAVPSRWAQYNESVYMRETQPGVYHTHPGVEPELPAFDFIGTRGVRIASEADPSPDRKIWFEMDPDLLALAEKAAAATELERCDAKGLCLPETPEVIIGGAGVTGSIFMDNARFREYLHNVFEAQVAEMETSAIAMVAHAHDVPMIAFRSLSDLAGGGTAEKNEIDAFEYLAARNSAALVLAFLDAYGAQATDLPVDTTFASRPYCEVNFSAGPTYAAKALDAELSELLKSKIEVPGTEAEFHVSQKDRAIQISGLAEETAGFASKAEILSVWGGYKGRTSPSLAMRLEVDSPQAREEVVKMGAALGYVFMQESVLVQCTPFEEDTSSVPSFELLERGETDVLSVNTIKSIFGMMLGQADGVFELGYTYYPLEDRYSTLGFSEGGDFERVRMQKVYSDLQTITGIQSGLMLGETTKWLRNPSNNWHENPDGESYLENGLGESVKLELDEVREDFLADLKQWLDAE